MMSTQRVERNIQKRNNLFYVRTSLNGKSAHLGSFQTLAEARSARDDSVMRKQNVLKERRLRAKAASKAVALLKAKAKADEPFRRVVGVHRTEFNPACPSDNANATTHGAKLWSVRIKASVGVKKYHYGGRYTSRVEAEKVAKSMHAALKI
jgi:hypothetical protein